MFSLPSTRIIMKCLLASLKTLINFKDCSGSCIKFLFRLFFALIVKFSPSTYHSLSEQVSGSQATFRTTSTSESQASSRKLEQAFRKGLDTRRIFTKCFHRSKQKVYFEFSSQKDSKKQWKPILALIQKVQFWFLVPPRKYSYIFPTTILDLRLQETDKI